MTVHSKYVNGALAYWETHLHRIVGAVGEDVTKFELLQPEPTDDTTGDPTRFTMTVVEVGAGNSTVVNSSTAGIAGGGLLFTTAANDNDGINLQAKGEAFGLHANNDIAFHARLEIDDADQSDFLLGLAITDTTLLAAVSDAIYFESLDASTDINAVTEKDNSETTSASAVGTLADNTEVVLDFYVEGTSTVYFYVNGVRQATSTTNLPDDEELTPSIHFLTGEANAAAMQLKDLRVYQFGRNETA
jgi:hypothetical protein